MDLHTYMREEGIHTGRSSSLILTIQFGGDQGPSFQCHIPIKISWSLWPPCPHVLWLAKIRIADAAIIFFFNQHFVL